MAEKPKKKAGSDARTTAYTVRYNEDEAGLIENAASSNSLEVGSWIRMVSVAAARDAKKGSGR